MAAARWIICMLLALMSMCLVFCNAKRELKIKVLRVSEDCKTKAATGDRVVVHYTCRLIDGTVLRNTYDKEPDTFKVGAREVILGLEYGMISMCVGEKRFIEVPSDMAYGEEGKPPSIPANATLLFEVELLEVKRSLLESILDRKLWFIIYIVAGVFLILLVVFKCLPNFPSQKQKIAKNKKKN
ncbi:peptidyl-prolyl cis-trans isomerase FKBP2 [Patella vulgata]|uniref:peptidyl-prolyl cis-trans isomerase FKBP2 n=1 Tax=Patella vulgata TaxID=6465 RepID=UPI00217FC2BB|nr:peptidyl-prolyl cis-trans isomerase FKBP2 [Patella vulgata]